MPACHECGKLLSGAAASAHVIDGEPFCAQCNTDMERTVAMALSSGTSVFGSSGGSGGNGNSHKTSSAGGAARGARGNLPNGRSMQDVTVADFKENISAYKELWRETDSKMHHPTNINTSVAKSQASTSSAKSADARLVSDANNSSSPRSGSSPYSASSSSSPSSGSRPFTHENTTALAVKRFTEDARAKQQQQQQQQPSRASPVVTISSTGAAKDIAKPNSHLLASSSDAAPSLQPRRASRFISSKDLSNLQHTLSLDSASSSNYNNSNNNNKSNRISTKSSLMEWPIENSNNTSSSNETSFAQQTSTDEPDFVLMHDWACAIYSYQAQDTDELTFKRGDMIFLRRRFRDGWSQGEMNGKFGMLPTNYVQVVPQSSA